MAITQIHEFVNNRIEHNPSLRTSNEILLLKHLLGSAYVKKDASCNNLGWSKNCVFLGRFSGHTNKVVTWVRHTSRTAVSLNPISGSLRDTAWAIRILLPRTSHRGEQFFFWLDPIRVSCYSNLYFAEYHILGFFFTKWPSCCLWSDKPEYA